MRILFTICGRAGSKGIKNKNIRDFVGKPLPYYTVSAIDLFLKKTDMPIEHEIVVNSDSVELLNLLKANGMRAVETIARSEALSGDTVGKIAVIQDCLYQMERRKNGTYDMVVDLDITSPLRMVEDIRKLIEVQRECRADVTTSVTQARRNPYFNQVMKTAHGYKRVVESGFTARQQAPEIYDMNASLYAYSPDFLRTGKGVLDGYCECVEMYDTGILDLDHENDFELMEVIAKYLFEKESRFYEVFANIR